MKGKLTTWEPERGTYSRRGRITFLFCSPYLSVLWPTIISSSTVLLRNPSPLRKMFKRVEKKLAKRKEEEELGITEEIREAIGLNDVDSDDSSSDESEASSSRSSPKILSKRKRLLDDDESDVSSDVVSEGRGSLDDPDDDEDEPGVQMTVEEALHNPLYIVSIQPDIRDCIVCPRKLLKNDTMASVHTRSQVRCVPTREHYPSRYGDLMTFVSPLFGRPISGGCPNSKRRPHLPNQMTTRMISCPLFSHQLHCDQNRPPMTPLHCQNVRPSG